MRDVLILLSSVEEADREGHMLTSISHGFIF